VKPASGESQLQGWLQRMMRGATDAEAETAQQTISWLPADRRRKLQHGL
jgi:hypothetical protein